MALFVYNGGSFTDPLSYSQIFVPPSCPIGTKPCTIDATVQMIGGIPRPNITSPLANEITLATGSSTPSANVRLKP